VAAVGEGGVVVAEFAEKGDVEAEAGGADGGVAGRATGDGGGRDGQAGDQVGDVVGFDQDHAAFFAGDGGEEVFGDLREQVHDGRGDRDEVEGAGGVGGSGGGGGHGREDGGAEGRRCGGCGGSEGRRAGGAEERRCGEGQLVTLMLVARRSSS